MTGILTLILFIVGIGICGAIYYLSVTGKLEKDLRVRYQLDDVYVSMDDRSFIGLNFGKGQVVLGSKRQGSRVYNFDQLLAVEVIQNNVSVTRTNRGSQLTGAAIGEIALGPVGAILGGLSGSSKTISGPQSLYLHIMVNDTSRPSYRVCFFSYSDARPDDPRASVGQKRMERFRAHLVNAMRQGQMHSEPKSTETSVQPAKSISRADEIQALWELKEKGILTEAEFQIQKVRLLGQG